MFNIDVNSLRNASTSEIQNYVEKLASHLKQGKDVKHNTTECALQALDQPRNRLPGAEVFEDLQAVILISIERGLDVSHAEQLEAIRHLRNQILDSQPKQDFDQTLPQDVKNVIFSDFRDTELAAVRFTNRSWNAMGAEQQIRAAEQQIRQINDEKIPLDKVLESKDANEIIEWILANPACQSLEYADFSRLRNFDNECLQKLTEKCPNLKHLNVIGSRIQGDALKYLAKTPNLQSLNISFCRQLEADALKHLANTHNLQSLIIFGCNQLESDALKHLINTPNLLSLEIIDCDQLESDALKHLKNTPNLLSLDITGCKQLESDALKHLKNTPNLLSLDINGCDQLEKDALKHLENTRNLQSLNIFHCPQFNDVLKNLENKISIIVKS